MQILTNFIQSWLNDSEKPLVNIYQYLRMYLFILNRITLIFVLYRLLLSIITFTNFV